MTSHKVTWLEWAVISSVEGGGAAANTLAENNVAVISAQILIIIVFTSFLLAWAIHVISY
ncbi:MAG: hypothetical protein COB04_05675 [Gammaproteobacteria bacterium]|nr:MAG: hypothetical protein COB04_05675 [Gammaproteobacteria bacterium]